MKKFIRPASITIIAIFISCLVYKQQDKDLEWEEENEAQSIADYYQYQLHRKAGPTGVVEPADRYAVEQQIENLANVNYKTNSKTILWNELGPDNVGGRTLSLLADKDHPGWIYAAAASGGVWLSKTSGTSWYHVTNSNNSDFYENLCVSSLTQTIDGDIYFSTGEGSFGGLRGGGIWRKSKDSTDFRRLSKTNPATAGAMWNNTNFMAASGKKDRIFAGNESGLYLSDDDGTTWVKANGSGSGVCTEVKSAPDGTIIALVGKKVYVSANDGDLFTLSATGLPNAANMVRGTIAIAASNTNYLYVVYARNGTNDCYGCYRSLDKGLTWQLVQLGDPYFNPFNDQGWYDIAMAVDPENPNRVFIGGVNFWEWNGPGTNFIRTGAPYIHSDIHHISFDMKTTPYSILVGCDGGFFRSNNKAKTFYENNKLYSTTQFYDMAGSRTGNVIGGTQDNGTQFINKMGNTPKASTGVIGGDGFFCEVGWKDQYEIKFGESQYANLLRNKGNSAMTTFYDSASLAYIGDANGKFSGSGKGQFSSPFSLWEHPVYDSISHFAIGVNGAVFITHQATDFAVLGGPKWYKLASFNGNVECMEFSPDGNILYFAVGTTVYRVKGLNTAVYDKTFDASPASHGISTAAINSNFGGAGVTSIACDLKDVNRVVVTTGNYGFPSHVFLSHNANAPIGNVTFSLIQGNLPAFPCYDAALDYTDTNMIIVATEYGIYASFNLGATWTEQNTGLARVAVYSIKQYLAHGNQGWAGTKYYIGTFGRGMYETSTMLTGVATKPVKKMHEFKIFPNPAQRMINLEGLHSGTVRILDLNGRCVMNIPLDASNAMDIGSLTPGTYILELMENGKREVTKFVKQ